MEEGIKEQQIDMLDNDTCDLIAFLRKRFDLNNTDLKTYSPLTLAFIGDSVFDLLIRTIIVENGNAPVNKLHNKVSSIVKASSQAKMFHTIEPFLTEKELSIYKRGRNAKSFTSAKNASISDYRIATGFEALLGYLYLDGELERVVMLTQKALEVIRIV